MDFRTAIAMALIVLIYFYFFSPQVPVNPPEQPNDSQTTQPQRNEIKALGILEEAPALLNETKEKWADQVLENEKIRLEISALGEIQKLLLKDYFEAPQSSDPMKWDFRKTQGFNRQLSFIDQRLVRWTSFSREAQSLHLRTKVDGIEIHRQISLQPDSYIIEIVDEFSNLGDRSQSLSQVVHLKREYPVQESPGFLERLLQPQADFEQAVWFSEGSLDYELLASVSQKKIEGKPIAWAGFSSKYFFFGVIPEWVDSMGIGQIQPNLFEERIGLREIQIPPSEKRTARLVYYLGPKEISELEKAGHRLERVIDYGNWIGPISRLLLAVLRFFYDIIPNFGVGIILLTLLVKLVLFPLSYKAAVSMKKLSLVQPKMKEIRDKFKSNPQRMQSEMMALYRSEKVNPVGGCLPMLLQMPIFFALYRVFFTSIEMRQQPFFGWITDLSQHDPYFITPVCMTGLMYLQQKLTPLPSTGGEENEAVRIQKAMFKWMPFIFGAVMIFLPAGLTLYFLVNALLSIIQQLYLNKKLSYLLPENQRELKQANGNA